MEKIIVVLLRGTRRKGLMHTFCMTFCFPSAYLSKCMSRTELAGHTYGKKKSIPPKSLSTDAFPFVCVQLPDFQKLCLQELQWLLKATTGLFLTKMWFTTYVWASKPLDSLVPMSEKSESSLYPPCGLCFSFFVCRSNGVRALVMTECTMSKTVENSVYICTVCSHDWQIVLNL